MSHRLRIALRGFRRSPSFTVTALLILTIGIGMAVAMFTVFDAVIVQPLPIANPDNVIELYTYRGDPKADYFLLRGDLTTVAPTSATMREIGGVAHWGAPPSPYLDGDRPLVLNRTTVTGNFFSVLGVRPFMGRLIRPDDERPGSKAVVVLSYGAWQKHFNADPDIVGRKLIEPYGRTSVEIIGVAPAGLDYPAAVEMWIPNWQPSDRLNIHAIARLAPNATPRAAQAEFFGTMKRLFPDRDFAGVRVQTMTQAIVGDVKPVLVLLATAVGLLLLIACVNVGNLLLLRAASRAREISIRRALGASYRDVVGQLVVESGLLGIAGGAFGLITSMALIKLLLAYAPPQLRRVDAIGVSRAPVVIALVASIGAVLVFGVIPALVAAGGELASPLRYDSRAGTSTRRGQRMRNALVSAQVALAVVMLAGAAMLGRSLGRLQGLSLGYNPVHLSMLSIAFPASAYADSTGKFDQLRANRLADQLTAGYRGVAGVAAVTPTLVPPFLGNGVFLGRLDREGQTADEIRTNASFPIEVGGADYFRVFGIPVKRGRAFRETDDLNAEYVAIVSESVAHRLWPNDDAVGKRIKIWNPDSTKWRTVIGVAGDINYRNLRERGAEVYLPWKQAFWQGYFAIRTSGPLTSALPALRLATTRVNPQVALWKADAMDDLLAEPLAQPRMSALLLSCFAFVSMLLAALGLYGVMASAVRGTTRELGVRAALGASPERLRRRVLAQALAVTGVGVVVGLTAVLSASRLLAKLLFDVSPSDPISMVGSTLLLLAVALLAAYLPARQATRVDPVVALRSD